MYNKIKNLTMLLFVAATMFTFASCNKEDDNNGGSGSGGSSSIDESKGEFYKLKNCYIYFVRIVGETIQRTEKIIKK
ncbi:MAG: hypothetical protein KBT03_05080 [Bacteroidales bacterium]|nr:hypothetical protein [Candidatus Scybalousia scybalohippi]